jgi:MinD-like ATPase involved in chromosome partitioning or flagellar assembly
LQQAEGDQQVDLPTYTSIWRIEKRLYKLYDFRLPMPLPIGQVAVFAAMAVPYVLLLTLLRVPFNHTLIWLYILPPGVATWLVTRPVLESKRLPELIKSQLRYVAEPRILCRMAPLAEPDVMIVSGSVWRPRAGRRSVATPAADVPAVAPSASVPRTAPPARLPSAWTPGPLPAARPGYEARPAGPLSSWPSASSGWTPNATEAEQAASASQGLAVTATPVKPAEMRLAASGRRDQARQAPPGADARSPASEIPVPAPAAPAAAVVADSLAPGAAREPAGPLPPRPVITVVGAGAARVTPPAVERALAGPSARRGDVRAGRVTVVPGGHRPGQPDLLQRDRARAQLPIDGSARILVLGCTVGAGQTMTTLLLGEVLASLRSDRVAVIDLNPSASSLARRAEARPAISQAALTGRSRLAVIGQEHTPGAGDGRGMGTGQSGGPRDHGVDAITFEAATGQHDLVLADPAAAAVPRLLAVAHQLVLVAPASGAAPGAIAMTFEWLDAHGRADLAAESIMVLNGVSRRSISHVEQAERVCAGRCRAIVRLPWDDQLQNQVAKRIHSPAPGSQAGQQWAGVLGPPTASAYTALAGVLVASLADQGQEAGRENESAHARQAES